MTPEEARALFQYNDWANQRSLDASAQLSNEQFVKPWPLSSVDSGFRTHSIHRRPARTLGAAGERVTRLRPRPVASGTRPRVRIQDDQFWNLRESPLAIVAASR